MTKRQKVVLFANTDWYLYNFRRHLAEHLSRDFDVLLLSPEGSYGPRLRDAGLRWQPTPMQRRSLVASGRGAPSSASAWAMQLVMPGPGSASVPSRSKRTRGKDEA